MTEEAQKLKKLVCSLRQLIRESALSAETILEKRKELENIHSKYKFDEKAYPDLKLNGKSPFTGDVQVDKNEPPRSLAEFFIWKQGAWKKYQTLRNYFSSAGVEICDDKIRDKKYIVHAAFAKHLMDPRENPIFDQHALRALWAIDPGIAPEEHGVIAHFLFKKPDSDEEQWKANGSGESAGKCYTIFKRRIGKISNKNKVSHGELDKLLMPLGRALKNLTETRREFESLSGRR
ncbi:hypothetical protein M0534_01455 [Methylonatrum kenyense]|uniref:hypothetical protein n=1 Tax=Methylonatrum kenyense TaxID=455253 RepID=UPI0020BEABD0|nr:hypothetical protein [Methylonatrum kenyense]MCK8514998.1 hypothetical protein [Methylonatrum kenyense]